LSLVVRGHLIDGNLSYFVGDTLLCVVLKAEREASPEQAAQKICGAIVAYVEQTSQHRVDQ